MNTKFNASSVRAFFLALALLASSLHGLSQSGSKNTPGTGLVAELLERSSPTDRTFRYRFKVTGYPAGESVGLLIETSMKAQSDKSGRTPVGQYRGTFSVDESGTILGVNGKPYVITMEVPPPGVVYTFTILSVGKKKLTSSVRVSPIPLEGSDGACRVQAILTAPDGAEYEIRGEGFPPGETVLLASGPEEKSSKAKAGKDGAWSMKFEPRRKGQPRGPLNISFTGQSCKPTLTLP